MTAFLIVDLVEHSAKYPDSGCLELFFDALYHSGARHALTYHNYSPITILGHDCRINSSAYRRTVYDYVVEMLFSKIEKLLKIFFFKYLCRVRH